MEEKKDEGRLGWRSKRKAEGHATPVSGKGLYPLAAGFNYPMAYQINGVEGVNLYRLSVKRECPYR